ncbi:MAG: hypothetical protein ACLPY1_22465 [Terracidiphilus sp.]
MRTDLSPQCPFAPVKAPGDQARPHFLCPYPLGFLGILAAAGLLAAAMLCPELLWAQTQATQATSPASNSAAKPVHRHKRPSPAKPQAVPDPPVPAPITPPVPETPKWPAFDKPAEASVVWDSHGLSIDAANSSLEQILNDVSMATGAKVDGLSSDQRVFGAYGPGPAREVLAQVLQGSGYNVLMVGDQGQGVPRQILLSVRQAAPSHPAARNNAPQNNSTEEEEAEEPQQPTAPEPAPNRPGFPPGAPPRSPQQIMQDMQQRQQQQLQQQQAPAVPGNYQPNEPNPPNPPN